MTGSTDSSGFVPAGSGSSFDAMQTQMIELQRGVQQLSATATSGDSLVEAVVGARGELRELRLDPRIYRNTDADKLAETITETIWEATRDVTSQLAKLMQPTFPSATLEADLLSVPAKKGRS